MMNFKINNAHLIFLIAIFSILFFPQAFVFNEDINVTYAFELDAGSIILSIDSLYKNYNMFDEWHSKFYGWTYYFISFLSLLPLKIFMNIFNIADKSLFYLSIKIIFFLIGLISSLLFFKVIEKISSSKNIALAASLLYFSGSNFHLFYYLHPETTGALFLFLAIFLLLEYIENRNNKYYLFGIASCVLSALSKHPFFFISCFALIPFIIIKLEEENKKSNYHYVLWYDHERTILIKHEKYNYVVSPKLLSRKIKPRYIYLSSLGENTLEFHKEFSKYLNNNPDIKLIFQPGTYQIRFGINNLMVVNDIYRKFY